MARTVEAADEELLGRVKEELEQPVDGDVKETTLQYYNDNKNTVKLKINHTL